MSCEYVVSRATAGLPQSTTQTIFNISGGKVLVLGMIGQATASIQVQANTGTVSIGSNTLWSDALSGIPAGDLLGLDSAEETGTTASHDPDSAYPFPHAPLVVQSGSAITFHCSASSTGQIEWTLWYRPLDPGASVSAA